VRKLVRGKKNTQKRAVMIQPKTKETLEAIGQEKVTPGLSSLGLNNEKVNDPSDARGGHIMAKHGLRSDQKNRNEKKTGKRTKRGNYPGPIKKFPLA